MDGRLPLLGYLYLCLALMGIAKAQSQPISSFRLNIEVSHYSAPSSDGTRSVTARIRSTDASGQPVIATRTNIQLQAYFFEPASLVVSEISGDFEEFELTNVSDDLLDLAGWSLRAGDGNDTKDSSRFIAGPALLPSGGIVRWSSRTNISDVFPSLAEAHRITRSGFSVFEVRNAAGKLVDQILVSGTPRLSETRWSSIPLIPVYPYTNGFSRVGTANRFHSSDWRSTTPSLGRLNSELSIPWRGLRLPSSIQPSAVTLTNGVWEGRMTLATGSSRHVQLSASFGNGIFWDGPIETLPRTPALRLEMVSGSTTGSESNPGPLAIVRVQLPGPLQSAVRLPVALSWSATGEFQSTNEVFIAPGASTAEFSVLALDDALSDGRSHVQLTAHADGFLPGQIDFTLDDNESGTLQLSTPETAPESGNRITTPSWVTLPSPAVHDTEILLTGTGRVRVQPRALIPAGSQSSRLDFRIEDDSVLNQPPFDDGIQAMIPNWPVTTASIRVIDSENATYALEAPQRVVEGTPETVRLRFPFKVDRPVEFELSSPPQRLIHPASVSLLPGQDVIEFPISLPDDQRITPNATVWLMVLNPEFGDRAASIELVDNDNPFARLDFEINPILFSSSPTPFRLQLRDQAYQPIAMDGAAQLRLLSLEGDAALSPTSMNLVVHNGVFDGDIHFTGSGSGVVLEAIFGSVTNRSYPLDILPGRIVSQAVADIAAWPSHPSLLALQYRTNGVNFSGVLVEMDPSNGTALRELDLPLPASRLAVSDAGEVAWIGAGSNTLFRIDLAAWKLDRRTELQSKSILQQILAIALSPGGTEDIGVVVSDSEPEGSSRFQVVGLKNGQQVPGELRLRYFPMGTDIVPGRTSGELYVGSSQTVLRLLLSDAGWSIAAERDLSGLPINFVRHLVLFQDGLLFGNGLVLDATTLADLPDFAPGGGFSRRSAAASFPELNCVLFADDSYNLQTYDTRQHSLIGQRQLPLTAFQNSLAPVDRLVRWGNRGVAVLSWDSQKLILVDEAPRFPGRVDLAVGVSAPEQITLPPTPNTLVTVDVTVSVTNLGPAVARSVQLALGPFQSVTLEPIKPGEVRVVPWALSLAQAGRLSIPISASSMEVDVNPTNNTTSVDLLAWPLSRPDTVTVHLPARHLISSPDGSELWLAVGPETPPEGVAVVNPATGERIRTLPVGPDPQRLFLSPDAQDLYVLLGTNRLVRWNLAAAAVTLDYTFPNESLMDLTVLPEPRRRLAVASRKRLAIMENDTVLQRIALPDSTARGIGVQGGNLWVASPNDLRAYKINTGNLNLNTSRNLFVPSGNYRFLVHGDALLFDGIVALAAGGELSYYPSSGVPHMPEDTVAYGAQSDRLRRYRLPDMFPVAEMAVPTLIHAGNLLDQVRWSTNGFAFRTDRDFLVTLRSALVTQGLASLRLELDGPESAIYNQPAEFHLRITNQGSAPSLPFQLTLRALGGTDTSIPDRLSPTPNDAGVGFQDAIPPGGLLELTIFSTPNRLPYPTEFLTLEAALTTAGGELNPNGTTVSKTVSTRLLQADLSTSLGPPLTVNFSEKSVLCTLSNRGPETVRQPQLPIELSRGLTLLGVDRGTANFHCCTQLIISDIAPELKPGEFVQVSLRVQTAGPGVYSIRAQPSLFLSDPDLSNNVARVGFDVGIAGDAALFPNMILPFSKARWSAARNQWIAGDDAGLTFLEPVTLIPHGYFGFPIGAANFHLTDADRSVWIAMEGRRVNRYRLDTGALEQTIQATIATGAPYGTVIPIPGHPELLVILGLDDAGQPQAVAYNNGELLPITYTGDMRWGASDLRGAATEDLRVYVVSGVGFQELELQSDGLHFRRSLDGFESGVDYVMAAANGLLRPDFTNEDALRIKDLPGWAYAIQWPEGVAYQLMPTELNGKLLLAFDLKKGHLLWQQFLPDHTGSHVAGSPEGVLLLGSGGGWLPAPENKGTDLRLNASLESLPLGVGQDFSVQLNLRQTGVWHAQTLKLISKLPPGLSLVSPDAVPTDGTIPIPDFDGELSIPVVLRASTTGLHTFKFQLESDAVDPTPGDVVASLSVFVPEEPFLMLPDQTVLENGSPLIFRLSGKAPRPMKVRLQAELMDAQTNDLSALSYELEFPTGSQELRVPWIVSDSRLESEEQFRVRWLSGDIPAQPESAQFTIANDDSVELQVRSLSVFEGDKASGSTVKMLFQLSEAPPFPVQLGFRTSDGTATAGNDYKPVEGTAIFGSNQRTNAVEIPIIGDLIYEPKESFNLDLFEPIGVTLPSFATVVTLLNDDRPSAVALTLQSTAEGQILLQFQGEPNVPYVLQSSETLEEGSWVSHDDVLVGTGSPQTIPLQGVHPKYQFFRLIAN